ncbi:MAG: hypothetical protein ACLGGX_06435 [Bdellovibrionia bacterium]
MAKFEFQVQSQGSKAILTMSGSIDEDADFSLINLAGHSEVDMNLQNLKSINSCGIREWIKWLSGLQVGTIQLQNCPKIIVDQINMVDGFLPPQAKVLSFYVPYYNDDSGSEMNVLFRYGQEYSDGKLTPPESVKDEDGNELEMDVIQAKYFKFISNMK